MRLDAEEMLLNFLMAQSLDFDSSRAVYVAAAFVKFITGKGSNMSRLKVLSHITG